MTSNEFTGPRDSSAHDALVWSYVEHLSDPEIESIMLHAETKAENIAHGRMLAGRPLNHETLKRLVRSAILREINLRAG